MKQDMPMLTNMMENAVMLGMLFSGCGFAVVSVSMIYCNSSDKIRRGKEKERIRQHWIFIYCSFIHIVQNNDSIKPLWHLYNKFFFLFA